MTLVITIHGGKCKGPLMGHDKALVDHLLAPKLEEGKGGHLQWGMDETYKGDG